MSAAPAKRARTILIMAGGTGGHVFPALAVADWLRDRGWQIVWLGTRSGMEARLVPERGYPLEHISFAGLRRSGVLRTALLPISLIVACVQSVRVLLRRRPDVVLGLGGYATFPGGLMASLLNRPLAIHEQNSVAGLTNRVLARLADGGQLPRPLPQQHEFARLNLTHVLLSKRKLIQLVAQGHVDGWDDPRMPTLVGARRRGFTPEGFKLFAERIGVSKSDAWIDMSVLEDCMREDLNARAPRRMAVLDPVRLVIDNYPEGGTEECLAPNHPQQPDLGRRALPFARELWIERDDYQEDAPKGYFRLAPGAEVRLRFAYIVRCTGAQKDAAGNVVAVHCTYDPATRSGTPGADARKVKGNIHWLSAEHAVAAEVRLYDRLFAVPFPGARNPAGTPVDDAAAAAVVAHAVVVAGDDVDEEAAEPVERNWLSDLNPASKSVITAYVEPALAGAAVGEQFQFERHGYFVADREDSAPGKPVFNRTVTLRDSRAPR